jgi:hypothetical protein
MPTGAPQAQILYLLAGIETLQQSPLLATVCTTMIAQAVCQAPFVLRVRNGGKIVLASEVVKYFVPILATKFVDICLFFNYQVKIPLAKGAFREGTFGRRKRDAVPARG